MDVPGGKLTVTDHRGFLLVYLRADSATALSVSQTPISDTEPTMKTFSPYEVVTSSSNVTATSVADAQALRAETAAGDEEEAAAPSVFEVYTVDVAPSVLQRESAGVTIVTTP